jgi:hypothetical protein
MQLEDYDAARHYGIFAQWWRARGDECLPADVLPPTGVVVTRDGEAIAACLVWLTNAKTAHVAFPIDAPGLSPIAAYKAISMAIDGVIALAFRSGCKMIWASAENRGVDRIFKRAGLIRTTPLNSYFMFSDPTIRNDILVGHDFEQQKG